MLIFVILFACISLVATRHAPAADDIAPPTDANLITAIDVSGSIGTRAEALQFNGIGEAIVNPDFLQTVARGYHGRVGFAAFTWSSQGDFTMPVPWSLIDSEAAARAVATRLRDALGKPRFGKGAPDRGSARRAWRRSLATDISAAIEHAMALLATAPYATGREVINVLTNGTDNIAQGPDAARGLAVSRGIAINGIGLGPDVEVARYLRAHVQGGPGSFVLEAHHPADLVTAVRKKFWLDLVGPPAAPSPRYLARYFPRTEEDHAYP
jgi:Protein of unknown function (DUF1194)